MKRFIAIWILLSAGLNIWQMDRIRNLEDKKPMVIYKADNAGAEIFGKVISRRKKKRRILFSKEISPKIDGHFEEVTE